MDIIIYDKAKWHYYGEFPGDLPHEQAFIHIGLYLGWIIQQSLLSEEYEEELSEKILKFNKRELTGPRIFELIDGCFDDEMLNDEGNAFTQYYFDFENGKYLDDYEELLVQNLPSMYHVKDTWKNYDTICRKIGERYKE